MKGIKAMKDTKEFMKEIFEETGVEGMDIIGIAMVEDVWNTICDNHPDMAWYDIYESDLMAQAIANHPVLNINSPSYVGWSSWMGLQL